MKLFINSTSPYARLVRVAILEKGLDGLIEEEIIDPWSGKPDFVAANPHERVPTLITQKGEGQGREGREGEGLSETAIILHYLERMQPEPTLYPSDGYTRMMSLAAASMGAIDVMAAIIITRRSAADFDDNILGQKRFRTIGAAFDLLNKTPPVNLDDRVSLAGIATAVAVDYALFRFPERDWLGSRPALRAWREACRERFSLTRTMPY